MKDGYVYIMASETRTIYVGVTSDLEGRVWEHKNHVYEGFTKKYDVTRLVYIAEFARIDDAIAWEKSLKGKTRAKKIALIEAENPRWNDLAWNWFDDEVRKERYGSLLPRASRGDIASLPRQARNDGLALA